MEYSYYIYNYNGIDTLYRITGKLHGNVSTLEAYYDGNWSKESKLINPPAPRSLMTLRFLNVLENRKYVKSLPTFTVNSSCTISQIQKIIVTNFQNVNCIHFNPFYTPPSKIGHPKKKVCPDTSFGMPDTSFGMPDTVFGTPDACFGTPVTCF